MPRDAFKEPAPKARDGFRGSAVAADRLTIDGIKFSERLILLNLSGKDPGSGMFRALAQNGVNIPFLTVAHLWDKKRFSFCVAAEKREFVEHILLTETDRKVDTEIVANIGMLTLFPHRRRLEVLGLSLSAFGNGRLPVHGVASSLSALTFVTDFDHLDLAVQCLKRYMTLPENHTPFRAEP